MFTLIEIKKKLKFIIKFFFKDEALINFIIFNIINLCFEIDNIIIKKTIHLFEFLNITLNDYYSTEIVEN